MKKLSLTIAALCLFGGATVFAADPTIKITSFALVDTGGKVADLCASVTPAPTTPTAVQIVVDPKMYTEAHYNTLVGSDGTFCITVTTYYGTANATLLK